MLHSETKVVYVCDLRKEKNDGTQCIKWCPEEALTTSHKRCASAESKNQRNQKAIPRAKRERKQAVKMGEGPSSFLLFFKFILLVFFSAGSLMVFSGRNNPRRLGWNFSLFLISYSNSTIQIFLKNQKYLSIETPLLLSW